MEETRELGSFEMSDGRCVYFRAATPDDVALIAEAISTASHRTLLHRFFIPLRGVAPEELRRLLSINPAREFCLIGEMEQGTQKRIVCGARYVHLEDPAKAEIALTVHDDFHRRGLGRWMLEKLCEIARDDGIQTFVFHVMATNEPMLQLIRSIAPHRRACFHSGHCEIEVDLL